VADIALDTICASRRREPLSLRWRVVLVLASVVISTFGLGAALVYQEAAEDEHAIAHRAVAASMASSAAIDREAAAGGFLLQSLSRSPLKIGDLRAHYVGREP
jgi:two-component system, NarL family, sensor kinase